MSVFQDRDSGSEIIDDSRANFRPAAYAGQLKAERTETGAKRDFVAFRESL